MTNHTPRPTPKPSTAAQLMVNLAFTRREAARAADLEAEVTRLRVGRGDRFDAAHRAALAGEGDEDG